LEIEKEDQRMPWQEVGKVELKRLFVVAVESGRGSFSGLCREFRISRACGYKWWRRYVGEGVAGLEEVSRRPRMSPGATAPELEALVVEERRRHPAWGARKLLKRLEWAGVAAPSERTVNRIFSRQGLILARERGAEAPGRFERSRANELWQLDHKGAYHGRWGVRAVPLVVEDDATRYLVGLRSLPDKGLVSTWGALWELLGEFGLPEAILTDNDAVFSGGVGPSHLESYLMRLRIQVLHGRPRHPQTQGKVERLNGTLARELVVSRNFGEGRELQPAFDRFREEYNFKRPHEALGLEVPGSRYVPSPRPRPERLPVMEYGSGAVLRKVNTWGRISIRKRQYAAGRGLCGEWVEIREVGQGWEIYYGPYRVRAVGEEESEGAEG
jgi:transposase InsO family protein